MRTLAQRVRTATADDESGMSLVEVLVAMFIFAMVASGLIYSLLSVKVLTRDSRAREVASNLAAQEIDLARDTSNLFALLDESRTISLNNDTFTVRRTTQWVSDPSADLQCGSSGSSTLRYKRVNVAVTWTKMRPGTQPVRSDTVIQPQEKINDPAKGTIIVSVKGVSGTGISGASVSAVPASPANGATPLTTTPSATDAQGCSYILKVVPGNYTVSVSKANHLDNTQATPATATVAVIAGQAATTQFQYDAAATFNVKYGAGYNPGGSEVFRTGDTMPTTFTNTYGTYVRSSSSTVSMTRPFALHPYTSGYDVFAGTCEAADPLAWPDKTVAGHSWKAARAAGAALPGASANVDLPMGIVRLSLGSSASARYLKAVAVNGPGDDPGCSAPTEVLFGFGTANRVPSDGKITVALPWGSWKLYSGTGTTASTLTTTVTNAMMQLPVSNTMSAVASNTVTLDPPLEVP